MSEAKRIAEGLLARHGVTKPPIDPESIAEMEDVNVLFTTFNGEAAETVHGFYDHEKSAIYVNSDDTPQEKLFTIAHELGHHFLHQEYSASEKYVPRLKVHVDTKEENEADEFASCLLAPFGMVANYARVFNNEELRSLFLVSDELITKAQSIGEKS